MKSNAFQLVVGGEWFLEVGPNGVRPVAANVARIRQATRVRGESSTDPLYFRRPVPRGLIHDFAMVVKIAEAERARGMLVDVPMRVKLAETCNDFALASVALSLAYCVNLVCGLCRPRWRSRGHAGIV